MDNINNIYRVLQSLNSIKFEDYTGWLSKNSGNKKKFNKKAQRKKVKAARKSNRR